MSLLYHPPHQLLFLAVLDAYFKWLDVIVLSTSSAAIPGGVGAYSKWLDVIVLSTSSAAIPGGVGAYSKWLDVIVLSTSSAARWIAR